MSYTITGSNAYIEPGETTPIYVTLKNNGDVTANQVYGILSSLDTFVMVPDSLQYFGDISAGSTFSSNLTPFSITARGSCVTGMTIPMSLYLYNAAGYSDTETFTLTIGNPGLTDPVGQDAYGYLIFDQGDTNYSDCPTYNWIGIAPDEGGAGTALAISDAGVSGDEGDQVGCDASETVSLPFTFKYYGQNYSQITVVSNGFIVFGTTNDHDFRNGRLPGSYGPNAMIAAFWDDLSTMTGGIYTYNDTANHLFIIEWYNLRNGYNRTSEETFQIILYNPAYYPTSSEDGPIKIQYKVFNNIDSSSSATNHGNYCTVGLKDHTGTVGLEYTYNNTYPVTARPITSQSALYITTPVSPVNPFLTLGHTTFLDNDENGYNEAGELVDVQLRFDNSGLNAAQNVIISITENDPWIDIRENVVSIGNIAGSGSGSNLSGLTIRIENGCPNNYTATVNVTVTATGYSWNRSFTITTTTPLLAIMQTIIHDENSDNIVQPGETLNFGIRINNTGLVGAHNVIATMYDNDPYLTVIQNISNYGLVEPESNKINPDYFTIEVSPDCPSNYVATVYVTFNAEGYIITKNFTMPISKPSIVLNSWAIDDILANANGVINSSETGYLILNLYNSQQSGANNVVVNLSSSNPDFVLTPTQITIDKIDKLYTFQATPQYQANASLTNGTEITISVNVTSDNAEEYNTSFNFTIGNGRISYDFNANNGSFTVSNSTSPGWGWGTSSYAGSHSSSKIWGCVLSGNYANSATYTLISPSISLSSLPVLNFWHRYNLELGATGSAFDGGRVMISTNNGSSWTLITPVGGYPYPSIAALGNTAGYCGDLNTWTQATFNLSAYANQAVKFRWQLLSDAGTNKNGWFIDDVLITGTASVSNAIGVLSGTVSLSNPVESVMNVAVTTSNIKVHPDATGAYKFRLGSGTFTIKANLPGFAEKTSFGTIQLNNTVSNINLLMDYLAAPKRFTWTGQNSTVNFKWAIDSRATFLHYNVYRKKGTDTWSLVAETATNEYSETLTDANWYDYKVTSHYATGESVPTQILHVVYPDNGSQAAPQSPQNVSLNLNSYEPQITWEEVNRDINGNLLIPWEYRIYMSDNPLFIPTEDDYIGSTNNLSWNTTSSFSSDGQWYKIKASIGFKN